MLKNFHFCSKIRNLTNLDAWERFGRKKFHNALETFEAILEILCCFRKI
jgi:hypothetical protein